MRLRNKSMKPSLVLFLVVLVMGFSMGFAGDDVYEVGDAVDNFSLKDYSGKKYVLKDFKDSEAIVLMFIATRCPVSNAYNERMVELYDNYQSKDVSFVGINSNKQEDVEEVAEHAEKHGFEFPVLKDHNNEIADEFGAQVTPEIYVLNPEYKILYHGRIDDSQREGNVESKDLRNALNEILADKSVSTTKTKAFGCSIKRVKK